MIVDAVLRTKRPLLVRDYAAHARNTSCHTSATAFTHQSPKQSPKGTFVPEVPNAVPCLPAQGQVRNATPLPLCVDESRPWTCRAIPVEKARKVADASCRGREPKQGRERERSARVLMPLDLSRASALPHPAASDCVSLSGHPHVLAERSGVGARQLRIASCVCWQRRRSWNLRCMTTNLATTRIQSSPPSTGTRANWIPPRAPSRALLRARMDA